MHRPIGTDGKRESSRSLQSGHLNDDDDHDDDDLDINILTFLIMNISNLKCSFSHLLKANVNVTEASVFNKMGHVIS